MKTKYFLLATVLLLSFKLHSQQGEILYTQFGQDTCQFFKDVPDEGFCLDMDGDSICDFITFARVFNAITPMATGFRVLSPEWKVTRCFNYHDIPDTIAGEGWIQWVLDYCDGARIDSFPIWRDKEYFAPYVFFQPIVDTTLHHLIFGFRHEISGSDEEKHYCYGWLECSIRWNYFTPGYGVQYPQFTQVWICVSRMAYCSIPDYPLCVGQTSLTEIEENETHSVAKLHPNPTNGQVTITGKGLRHAEVVNMLGQRVATATGQGETLQADLGGLPAGVYFVRVTDNEGRRCVRKVVKE